MMELLSEKQLRFVFFNSRTLVQMCAALQKQGAKANWCGENAAIPQR